MRKDTLAWVLSLLQILVVFIFLWHGIPKAFNPAGAITKFEGWGLPGILGPITGWVEVVATTLLFVRKTHRVAVATLAGVIMGALITVQLPGGMKPGLERDLLVLGILTLLAVQGPGRLALGKEATSDH